MCGSNVHSGVAVLTDHAITNAAAPTLEPRHRRWPRSIAAVGLGGCVPLIASLPPSAIVIGTGTLVVGLVVRAVTTRYESNDTPR